MGSVQAHASPVSQVAWKPAASPWTSEQPSAPLVLTSGATDGGVRLHAQTLERLISQETAGSCPGGKLNMQCMERLGTVVQPDLHAVTCLALSTTTAACEPGAISSTSFYVRTGERIAALLLEDEKAEWNMKHDEWSRKTSGVLLDGEEIVGWIHAGYTCLLLAVGKQAGITVAWRSPPFAAGQAPSVAQSGGCTQQKQSTDFHAAPASSFITYFGHVHKRKVVIRHAL